MLGLYALQLQFQVAVRGLAVAAAEFYTVHHHNYIAVITYINNAV